MSKQFAFNSVPTLKKRRSSFDLSHSVKTSMNTGTLYPVYIQEVYPGDTFKGKTNIVARVTSSFLRPVMDNAFMDVYYFFVPNRLVYDKWSQVMGENVGGAWAQQTPVAVPTTAYDPNDVDSSSVVYPGSVGDYLGLPLTSIVNGDVATTYPVTLPVSLLPFRAFALIYDEWFRDQNNIQPMNIIKGNFNATYETLNNSDWSPTNYTGKLPKVGKVHDYFTSCLPSPQKGNAVNILGDTAVLPIYPMESQDWAEQATIWAGGSDHMSTWLAEHYSNPTIMYGIKNVGSGWTLDPTGGVGYAHGTALNGGMPVLASASQDSSLSFGAASLVSPLYGSNAVNQVADLSAASISINELRYAIALQRMLEKDALGGNRYTEYLLAHFGVMSPDARLQRTELLGGHRFPLSVQQVASTNASGSGDSVPPVGTLGAYSLSNGDARFTKGFVEHGFVIGVACIRYYHTYQQGIERFWSRKDRIDFYDPVFAHIGEQPVYTKELFYQGSTANDTVFGYNEAWADLRYRPNRVTGQMRSDISNTLDIWHFADDYANAPTLNASFIQESTAPIDRTLSVPSSSQDQFIVDIYHQVKAYRCLPVYSTPSTLGV